VSDELEERRFEDEQGALYARWAAAPLFTLGFLSPVPFGIAYARTRARRHLAALVFWVTMLAGLVASIVIAAGADHGAKSDVVGLFVIANWIGATVHTLVIRKDVGRAMALERDPRLESAERLVGRRRRAARIARSDPDRALELGIGRPDVEGAFDGGLIDVNHAPAEVLRRLPGIGPEEAERIIELRMNGSGFVSAEDLGMVLDLDPGVQQELSPRAVFLPRF